jgi:hypothetical protein
MSWTGWKDFSKKDDGKWKDYRDPKKGNRGTPSNAGGYGGNGKQWKNPTQSSKDNPYLVCGSCSKWCYTNMAKKNDYRCKCGEAFGGDESGDETVWPALGSGQASGNKPKAKTDKADDEEQECIAPLAGLLKTIRLQVPEEAMSQEMQIQMQKLSKWTAKAEAEKQAKLTARQPTLAQIHTCLED